MKTRRQVLLIGGALGMAKSARALESWESLQETPARTQEPSAKRSRTDQEQGPRELQQKVDQLLRDELTQHWYPRAIDRRRGGFHQNMARDWSRLPDDNVFLPFQARLTWAAAYFAQYSRPHHDEFVEYARHGIAFLDQTMRDRQFGGFHWLLNPAGMVDPKLSDEKPLYGAAFLILAASKAAQVTGDELALKVASDQFDWLEQHAHDTKNGGYFDALGRDGTPILRLGRNVPKRGDQISTPYGLKSLDAHCHAIEALTALSKVDKRDIVKERLREYFLIFRDRMIAESGALSHWMTPDWRPSSMQVSFGHQLEIAFFLVEAAHALGMPDDPQAWQGARLMVDYAFKWGWDSLNGGFFYHAKTFNSNTDDDKKIWWVQAEAINCLLFMHWKFADQTDRYWTAFFKVWDFIERHQIDPVHGGWYWSTTRAGRQVGDNHKSGQWKANYHTSRALINVSRLLGRLTATPEVK